MSWQLEQLKNEAISAHRLLLAADRQLMILQKLQGHLEIATLLEAFTQQLEKQIDITQLVWEYQDMSHIIKRKRSSLYQQTFLLKLANSPLGVLQYDTPYKLDEDEINLIHAYHHLFLGPLNNAIEYYRVRHLALLDNLTGHNNLSRFKQDLHQLIALADRKNNGLILMIFNLDHFKNVNEIHGCLKGDQILRQFSYLLGKVIRSSDRCYRLNDDEFATILIPANKKSAQLINKRLKSLINQDPLLALHRIKSSVGCAVYRQGDKVASMFERAYQYMQKNKSR